MKASAPPNGSKERAAAGEGDPEQVVGNGHMSFNPSTLSISAILGTSVSSLLLNGDGSERNLGGCLEQHLYTDCDLALAVSFLNGDGSKRCVDRGRIRHVELDVIQGVEAFQAELRRDALLNADVFEQRQVEVVDSVAANTIETGANALDIVRQHLGGAAIEARFGIEPAFGAALLDGNLYVMKIAVEDGVTEAKSIAGLAFKPALKLPAAKNRLGREGHRGKPLSAPAHWKFVDRAENKAVGKIEIREHFLRSVVRLVPVGDRLHKLGVGPAHLETQPAAHAFLGSRLQRMIVRVTGWEGGLDTGELGVRPQQL
jgi:hypothetical protein